MASLDKMTKSKMPSFSGSPSIDCASARISSRGRRRGPSHLHHYRTNTHLRKIGLMSQILAVSAWPLVLTPRLQLMFPALKAIFYLRCLKHLV